MYGVTTYAPRTLYPWYVRLLERDAMRKRRRGWWTWGIGVVPIVLLGVALWYRAIGPRMSTHRQHVGLVQSAFAELPPYPGSHADQTTFGTLPLGPPSVLVTYSFDGTCRDVQAFYSSEAQTRGWTPEGGLRSIEAHPGDPRTESLNATYQMMRQGYRLTLEVGCYVDQSYSGGFTVLVRGPA